MKPFIKWQGGKRRELAHIRPFIPNDCTAIAEPFCGGAAVAFDNEGPAFLNDTNSRLINLYKVLSNPKDYARILQAIAVLKNSTPEELERRYYAARDYINQEQPIDDPYCLALAFLIIRQQCFSGMERYNKSGEFNVPWGRYKTFSCVLDDFHHEFLAKSTLSNIDAVDFINTLPPSTFVFLDPPYLDRAGYEQKDGGLDLHTRLADCVKALDQSWLIVHSDHPFYREAYADYKIVEVPFAYSQRWTNGDYDAKVVHLYITNQ